MKTLRTYADTSVFGGVFDGEFEEAPFEASGQVMRGTLTDGLVDDLTRPFILLAVWGFASLALAYAVMIRRR